MTSFIKYDADCHFPIQNLPYGVFTRSDDATPSLGVAIGAQSACADGSVAYCYSFLCVP